MTTFLNNDTASKLVGPSFIALQVRNLETSKSFYVDQAGLKPIDQNSPNAIVFDTKPVPFAIRTPMIDLDATSNLGWGVSLWMAATDADVMHANLNQSGVSIILPPADGPFGRFFAFRDPDGYSITVHTHRPKAATTTLDAAVAT
jgi:predicted enzyme related to lactoylglutathione lyase